MKDSVKYIIEAFDKIDFVSRFEGILTHVDFDNRMSRIDNKEILIRLSNIGYQFKIFNPGKDFYYDSKIENWRFRFSFNLNGGIIIPYIYIYDDQNNKIGYDYPNLIFTYKYLIDDIDRIMEPSTVYCSYTEFEEIISELLRLYEDFTTEFLRQSKL